MRNVRLVSLTISMALSVAALADAQNQAAGPSLVPFPGEVACENLAGADFKPGQLKLPLTVHERSGVERKGALVSAGVEAPARGKGGPRAAHRQLRDRLGLGVVAADAPLASQGAELRLGRQLARHLTAQCQDPVLQADGLDPPTFGVLLPEDLLELGPHLVQQGGR